MKWEAGDVETALRMNAEGYSNRQIGDYLGRAENTVRSKLTHLRDWTPPSEVVIARVERAYDIPPHVMADRDRRLGLVPRDLTALLMGDPIR